MTKNDRALERLRARPGPLDDLVSQLLDDVLAQPAKTLLDPAVLVAPVTAALRASLGDPKADAWIVARLETALARAAGVHGRVRDYVPKDALAVAERLLARPHRPDPELVRALIDHAALRGLLRETLQTGLLDFGTNLIDLLPGPIKSKGLGQLFGAAMGVAAAVGASVDSKLEGRVRAFVDGALSRFVTLWVTRITSPEFAGELAQWRTAALAAVVDQPLARLVAEVRKTDPGSGAREILAALRPLATWDGLEGAVKVAIGLAARELGEQPVRELVGAGDAWRPVVQTVWATRAHAFVETPAFAAWLTALLK